MTKARIISLLLLAALVASLLGHGHSDFGGSVPGIL
jgi:hypothetical protein